MAETIVQINFKFNVPRADYEAAVSALADDFAAVEGLRWKIWLMNEEQSESGGLMLFSDASSAEAFLGGPLAAAVQNHPAVSDMTVKQFDIMAKETMATRGPI